jgi:hypothetical protein
LAGLRYRCARRAIFLRGGKAGYSKNLSPSNET